MCNDEKVDAYGLKKFTILKIYINSKSKELLGLLTQVSGLSWIIMPCLTIFIRNSIFGLSLKLYSKNKQTNPNTKGVEIIMVSKINKIYFFFNNIFNFKNIINKKIEKITEIDDGLELNSNNIIKLNLI